MTQKQHRSRKEMEKSVERYRNSGLSQKKFAARRIEGWRCSLTSPAAPGGT